MSGCSLACNCSRLIINKGRSPAQDRGPGNLVSGLTRRRRRGSRSGMERSGGRFSAAIERGALVYKDAQPFLFTSDSRGTGTSHGLHDGEIEAPMPGKVTAVDVSLGEKVAEGQRLLTLEAMKMEHALTAPFDGTVAELNAMAGTQVTEGQLLVKVVAAEQ